MALCRPIDNSSKLIINVTHDSVLKNKCLGKIEIDPNDLLELQQSQPNEGKYIELAIRN